MGAGLQGQESGRISLRDEANLLARLSERQSQLVLELLKQAAEAGAVEAKNQQLASDLADSVDRIQEVHHRIRNHLQTVTGLLSAHELTEASPTARQALRKSVARLGSIAAIHNLLTREPASGVLELPELVPDLAAHLLRSMDAEGRVDVRTNVLPLRLQPREATAFVLILAELVSNAIEHGFSGGARGRISIRVDYEAEKAVLDVRDDGCGLPADFELRKANGLGLGLAYRLAERDLGGSMTARNDGGAVFTVAFPAGCEGCA